MSATSSSSPNIDTNDHVRACSQDPDTPDQSPPAKRTRLDPDALGLDAVATIASAVPAHTPAALDYTTCGTMRPSSFTRPPHRHFDAAVEQRPMYISAGMGESLARGPFTIATNDAADWVSAKNNFAQPAWKKQNFAPAVAAPGASTVSTETTLTWNPVLAATVNSSIKIIKQWKHELPFAPIVSVVAPEPGRAWAGHRLLLGTRDMPANVLESLQHLDRVCHDHWRKHKSLNAQQPRWRGLFTDPDPKNPLQTPCLRVTLKTTAKTPRDPTVNDGRVYDLFGRRVPDSLIVPGAALWGLATVRCWAGALTKMVREADQLIEVAQGGLELVMVNTVIALKDDAALPEEQHVHIARKVLGWTLRVDDPFYQELVALTDAASAASLVPAPAALASNDKLQQLRNWGTVRESPTGSEVGTEVTLNHLIGARPLNEYPYRFQSCCLYYPGEHLPIARFSASNRLANF